MIGLRIHLEGDGAFADLADRKCHHVVPPHGEIRVAALDAGMVSGKPSVAIGIVLPNGEYVLAETSLSLFLTAADALKARFGDPRQ